MTDIVTYCDVNTCGECPRYGDDCDGDKKVEHTDLISRADAIEAVEGLTKYMEKLVEGAEKFPEAHTKNYKHDMEQQIVGVAHASQVILELPSADTEPKRVLQGYCKGANTIKTIRHEELTQIANTRKAVESAEAVQGEWIDIDNYYRMATCSHCHKVTMFEKWGEYTKPYNFCPNCGAIMTPYKGGDTE